MPHALLYPGDPLAEHKNEILDWIEAVTGKKVPRDLPFEEVLKDGVILCNMMNKLVPGSVKIHKGSDSQHQENLVHFQQAMREFGVPMDDIFQTKDLFEAKNIKHVVDSLAALAKTASNKPDYTGPELSKSVSVISMGGTRAARGKGDCQGCTSKC